MDYLDSSVLLIFPPFFLTDTLFYIGVSMEHHLDLDIYCRNLFYTDHATMIDHYIVDKNPRYFDIDSELFVNRRLQEFVVLFH